MSAQNRTPAFPSTYEWKNDSDMVNSAPNGMPVPPGGVETIHHGGMTLRDYFAAKAMQAFIADDRAREEIKRAISGTSENGVDVLSQMAYIHADAMLKARQQ